MKVPKKSIERFTGGYQAIRRGWEAGDTGRLYSDWAGDYAVSPMDVAQHLPTIRRRAREQAKNDPYLKKWRWLQRANIIGHSGFRLQPEPLIGEPEAREAAKRAVLAAWNGWADSTDCDATGRRCFAELCWRMVEHHGIEGEAIIRLCRDWGNRYGFALKIYRPDALDVRYNERLANGNSIENGVEVDSWGKPVAYHFLARKKIDAQLGMWTQYVTGGASAEHLSIPASEIVHIYNDEEEEQRRGFPCCHTALPSLHHLNEYAKAELVAARESASRVRTYYAEDPQQPPSKWGSDERTQEVEPGMSEVLPVGWKAQDNQPLRPNQAFGDFHKVMLRRISNALLSDYNTFANDLEGVTYGSLRNGKLTEQDMWRILQVPFRNAVRVRIYPAWLASALAEGAVPGYGPQDYDTLLPVRVRGRNWPWLDPKVEGEANALAVDRNWKTNSQCAEELDNDYIENARVADREREFVASLEGPQA